MTALHLRGVVLPGDEERDVWVVDGELTFEPVADAETVVRRGWLIPGLVDLHAHLALRSPAGDDADPESRARASAVAQRDAGVLALREPGSPDEGSRALLGAESLPRTYRAGRFLSTPGRYIDGYARETPSDELPAVAVEEARSSGWAKLIGDWEVDGRREPNQSPETVRAVADAVHAAGGRLAVHITHPDAAEAAIEAGVDSIEHGVGVGTEHLDRMRERGIALVPTMCTVLGPDWTPGRDAPSSSPRGATIAVWVARHAEMVRLAHEAGVRVLAGTDAGVVDHGLVREEVRIMRAAGLPGAAALAAASWDARAFLGLPGLEEGAPADVVVYDADPREDPATLATPVAILLAGHRIS